MGRRTQYVIHACLDREWYVNDYLVPSMVEQGIPPDAIEVWMDRNRDGCLFSCMKCFAAYGKRGGGRWHLQDDVCISSDFKAKTEQYDDGVVAGFFKASWQTLTPMAGRVPAVYLWNSFQCLRIPDDIAGGCADWFFNDAIYQDIYKQAVETNKMDDTLFHDWYTNAHADVYVTNLSPSIVEHVDHLIGGSVINRWRVESARGDLWDDDDAYEELRAKLARR